MFALVNTSRPDAVIAGSAVTGTSRHFDTAAHLNREALNPTTATSSCATALSCRHTMGLTSQCERCSDILISH